MGFHLSTETCFGDATAKTLVVASWVKDHY